MCRYVCMLLSEQKLLEIDFYKIKILTDSCHAVANQEDMNGKKNQIFYLDFFKGCLLSVLVYPSQVQVP